MHYQANLHTRLHANAWLLNTKGAQQWILLPIALPGIITGISMLNMFKLMGINLSLETVILGHATGLVSIAVGTIIVLLSLVLIVLSVSLLRDSAKE